MLGHGWMSLQMLIAFIIQAQWKNFYADAVAPIMQSVHACSTVLMNFKQATHQAAAL